MAHYLLHFYPLEGIYHNFQKNIPNFLSFTFNKAVHAFAWNKTRKRDFLINFLAFFLEASCLKNTEANYIAALIWKKMPARKS